MKNKKWAAFVLLLSLTSVIALVFQSAFHHQRASERQFDTAQGERVSPTDVSGGVKINRGRIDDYIARVRNSSIVDVENGLADYEVAHHDAQMPAEPMDGINQFEPILADRRVARLYSEYSNDPNEFACERCAQLAEKWIREHKSRLTAAVKYVREFGGFSMDIEIGRSNQACASSAFLLMSFCNPRQAIDYIGQWEKSAQAIYSDTEWPNPAIKGQFDSWSLPDDLLVFNLCLVGLQRESDSSKALKLISSRFPHFEKSSAEGIFCKWDSHTNPFDFTHVHRGVPIDDSKVLTRFRYCKSFFYIGVNSKEEQRASRDQMVRMLLEK